MKLSIFTTITDPFFRGDNVTDALDCYEELADELVIIDGGRITSYTDRKHTKVVTDYAWPKEFSWEFIGQQFQRGYEATSGDWVIHADIDFIFHENDFATLRKALELNNDAPAVSFWKYQFILPDRYNLKSRLVIAVNKGKYGDRLRFDSGGDLCQPSLDGKELRPDQVPEARIPFYNYERLTKTKAQISSDAGRMERAYQRYFGGQLYASDMKTAYEGLIDMMVGRYNKPQQEIPLTDHPKFVQKTIANLRPEQWGYNGFGLLPENNYVKGVEHA